MARKSRKNSSPPADEDDSDFDELSDDNDEDSDDVDYEPEVRASGEKLRDWRDVERYKEMRELRHLVDDDFDFDDLETER